MTQKNRVIPKNSRSKNNKIRNEDKKTNKLKKGTI